MKNEIHILLENLAGEQALMKYENQGDIEYTEDEPATIKLVRIIDSECHWTITKDAAMTILDFKDTVLRIHWMNNEPDYLVVREHANADDVGEFNGDFLELIEQYQIPMNMKQWIGYQMILTRVFVKLKPLVLA